MGVLDGVFACFYVSLSEPLGNSLLRRRSPLGCVMERISQPLAISHQSTSRIQNQPELGEREKSASQSSIYFFCRPLRAHSAVSLFCSLISAWTSAPVHFRRDLFICAPFCSRLVQMHLWFWEVRSKTHARERERCDDCYFMPLVVSYYHCDFIWSTRSPAECCSLSGKCFFAIHQLSGVSKREIKWYMHSFKTLWQIFFN